MSATDSPAASPDHPEIYRSQADQYEALVAHEDYQNNLLPAIQQIVTLPGLRVVELGAGTGRLTCLLAPQVESIHAFDISEHMLSVAIAKLTRSGWANWQAAVSDHRQIPLPAGAADLIISGWSVCYVAVHNPATWQAELARTLDEIRRLLRPGGTAILIETLGTGSTQPNPPEHLHAYLAAIEAYGFQRAWIRTDYRFASLAEAETLTRFFFGEAMLAKLGQDERGVILPECTGLWWLRLPVG